MDDSDRPQLLLIVPRRGGSTGFTLAEVLVAITIVALLTAVIVPSVLNRLDVARADAIVTEMQSLERAIRAYQRDVGRYPKSLEYLHILPGPSGSQQDICGADLSAKNKLKYRGPYISRILSSVSGGVDPTTHSLATGDVVQWALVRTTVTMASGTQQVIQISISGPPQGVAEKVETVVDGVLDGTTGTVQYTPPLNANSNTLLWTFPVINGAC